MSTLDEVTSSDPQSVYASILDEDGCMTWDIPPSITQPSLSLSNIIGPFHHITHHFREYLKSCYKQHFRSLTQQLLEATEISNLEVWTLVIMNLSERLIECISVKQNSVKELLDARDEFKVELIPDLGLAEDSYVVPGVVFRKNIAHRQMRRLIQSPKILLLAGALDYQCSNLMQLHTDIKKEKEFLSSAIEKILSLCPDVLVVERTVAMAALEKLREAEITLVSNVSMEDLTSLAIHTDAKIVENVLEVTHSCLGNCEEFSVTPIKASIHTNTNGRKPFPLMIFKVCSDQLACTAVLRGASEHELASVREVLTFAVFAGYRLYLENAFLVDGLSITAASTSAFGIEGFTSKKWKQICSSIIQQCVQCTQAHQNKQIIEFVSPVIAKWTSAQSHASVVQRRDYSDPILQLESHHPHLSEEENLSGSSSLQSVESCNVVSTFANETSADNYDVQKTLPCSGNISFCMTEMKDSKSNYQTSNTKTTTTTSSMLGKKQKDLMGLEEMKESMTADVEDSAFRLTDQEPEQPSSFTSSSLTNKESNTQLKEDWCPWKTWSDVEDLRKSPQSGSLTSKTLTDSLLNGPVKFNIIHKQQFSASFANRNHMLGIFCESDNVQSIDFCSADDLSLSDFLKSIAADAPKRCPAGCGGGNSSHLRTFLHGAIRLAISVVSLPDCRAFENPDEDIWFWTRPKGVLNKPMRSICRIRLSEESKSLSFGQFLQLAFNTPYLKVFGRQLFLEHAIYFGFDHTVACVSEERISLNELNFPSPVLDYSLPLQIHWAQEAGNKLLEETGFVYEALERLHFPPLTKSIKSSTVKTPEQIAYEYYVKFSLIPGIVEERQKFCSEIQSTLNEVDSEKITNVQILETFLKLNTLWRQLGINALSCSATMHDPFDQSNIKMNTASGEDSTRKIGTRVSAPLLRTFRTENSTTDRSPSLSDLQRLESTAHTNTHSNDGDDGLKKKASLSRKESWDFDGKVLTEEQEGRESTPDDGLMAESPFMAFMDQPFRPLSESSSNNDGSIQSEQKEVDERKKLTICIPSTPSYSTDEDGLQRLASLQTLEHGEKDEMGKLKRNSSVGNIMEMLDREAHLFHEELNTSSPIRHRSMSLPASPRETTLLNQLDKRLDISTMEEGGDFRPRMEDEDFASFSDMNLIPQSPLYQGLERSPQTISQPASMEFRSPPGHGIELSCRVLFPLGSDDVVIPVFEAEPASIVAHVLSSISYHKELQQSFESLAQFKTRHTEGQSSMDFDHHSPHVQSSESSAFSRAGTSFLESSNRHKNRINNMFHIVQRVEDTPLKMPSSHARFEVISYFAPQFSKLRSRCIDGGERSFIMSMSRSKRWKANGGKSKSYFAKTLDDRFIIKGVSKSEKASFLEKLGPCYFNYMEEQFNRKEQVSLAKVLGLFQISMKSANHRTFKFENGSEDQNLKKDWVLDVVIMENVFYNHNCTSVYDLKGCHRRRFTAETKKDKSDQSLVFLDSNIKKHNYMGPPLLITQETWNGLSEALHRDTEFLQSNSVMDYSLLVGVDKDTNSIVVAIIDYIRQYTWDKKLENWFKSGFTGEVKEEPTIISPVSYQKRFLDSILGYFIIVPLYNDIN